VLEDAAGMSLARLVTQHAGHASQLTAELSLAAVDMLVFVGGDGTVFEGLQVRHLGCAEGVSMLLWVQLLYNHGDALKQTLLTRMEYRLAVVHAGLQAGLLCAA
jgi:predicted polyphosphate/ATP-dependent NAD kinase